MREIGDILTIAGEEYAIIDKILYENVDYILTSKYKNDEPIGEYIAYELVGGDLLQITDKRILEKIVPIFSKNIKKIVEMIKTTNEGNID